MSPLYGVHDQFIECARDLRRTGLTYAAIARALGIATSTAHRWLTQEYSS